MLAASSGEGISPPCSLLWLRQRRNFQLPAVVRGCATPHSDAAAHSTPSPFAPQRGDPLYPVRILGSKCKVHESDQHYHNTEREVNLVKWNDREDTTIDRFDGAALLSNRSTPFPSQSRNPLC